MRARTDSSACFASMGWCSSRTDDAHNAHQPELKCEDLCALCAHVYNDEFVRRLNGKCMWYILSQIV
jgi:hypothetical protein